MERIQLGIVGAGLIWDLTHKHKLRMLTSTYVIRAFSVRSASKREKLAREYPDSEIYTDYQMGNTRLWINCRQLRSEPCSAC
jgi:predicted dehydrogenase